RARLPGGDVEARGLVAVLPGGDPARLLARGERARAVHRPARGPAPGAEPVSAAERSVLQRPHDRLGRRRLVNRGMELLAWLAAATAVGLLGVVVWSVAKRGAGALNLDLITKTPVPFALTPVHQGLANAFVGTFVLVGVATLMALPFGILIAIYV